MANAFTTQLLEDGPRNVVVKAVGILDTSDLAATTLLDPATLTSMMPGGAYSNVLASQLAIKKIQWSIEDGLEVRLQWDATTPVLIEDLTGRGTQKYFIEQFLQNNSGAGKTGKILVSTEGWAASKIYSFTLYLWCVKQGSFG